MKMDSLNLTPEIIAAGALDAIKGDTTTTLLTPAQLQEVFNSFQTRINEVRMKKQAEAGSKNVEAGTKFLEENAKREGVVTTESGLQYKIIRPGTGPSPTKEERVKVHYKGMLFDGTTFDSSYDRGEPITFGVTQVIPGWTEALQIMKKGAKWELYIPSNLAYGPNGMGNQIPPNATLVFEVELLDITK